MGKDGKKINEKRQSITIQTIIGELQEIQNDDFLSANDFFITDFERLIDRLKDTSFKLAIVGEFSSGKSTFLNALIGKDLLKHGRKETTATITEIYNDSTVGDSVLIDVYCSDGTIKHDISVNDIMNVTATDSESYSVANDIDKVTVRSKILENDSKICFVDTPGLNGIADKHREKTIEQIKNSHACMYLLQVRGVAESDIEFIKCICKYQHNIIFVQNFIDELKELEGETSAQKIEAQRKIIEERIVAENKDVNYKIVGVSARKALISKASEFSCYNGEELTEETRNRLYRESGFDDILDCINDLIQKNERDKIQQRDTVEIALILLGQLKELIKHEDEKLQQEWDNSIEGTNSRNGRMLLDTLKQNYLLYKSKLDDYIEADISEIRKLCNRDIVNGIDSIEKDLNNILAVLDTIEGFDKYVAESLPGYLYKKISEIEDILNNRLNIRFENLICNAVSRIKQYTSSQTTAVDIGRFEVKSESKNLQSFSEEESEITRLQRKIIEKKKIDEKCRRDVDNKSREKRQLDNDLNENERDIANNYVKMNEYIISLLSR